MPGMKATGMNTAASVAEVAITARPISSAASVAATLGGLPIARWRSMFSTSTMASSTRMPTTTASASSVIMFRLKPRIQITPKVGMIDSGSASAEIHVARQSRRNHHTTSTASAAPSHSMAMEELKDARISSMAVLTSLNSIRGFAALSSAMAFSMPSPTAISLEPRVRLMPKLTTGSPSIIASCRRSAWPSVIVASADSGSWVPSDSTIGNCSSVCALSTVPTARMACSLLPWVARPPERSSCERASCADTSPAVRP